MLSSRFRKVKLLVNFSESITAQTDYVGELANMEEIREEIPVFGLWWIWVLSAIGYCLLDCFLRCILVPSCLNHYYCLYKPDRKESKVQSLPGHSNAVITERCVCVCVQIVK